MGQIASHFEFRGRHYMFPYESCLVEYRSFVTNVLDELERREDLSSELDLDSKSVEAYVGKFVSSDPAAAGEIFLYDSWFEVFRSSGVDVSLSYESDHIQRFLIPNLVNNKLVSFSYEFRFAYSIGGEIIDIPVLYSLRDFILGHLNSAQYRAVEFTFESDSPEFFMFEIPNWSTQILLGCAVDNIGQLRDMAAGLFSQVNDAKDRAPIASDVSAITSSFCR